MIIVGLAESLCAGNLTYLKSSILVEIILGWVDVAADYFYVDGSDLYDNIWVDFGLSAESDIICPRVYSLIDWHRNSNLFLRDKVY